MGRPEYYSYDERLFARADLSMALDGWNINKYERRNTGAANDEPDGLP